MYWILSAEYQLSAISPSERIDQERLIAVFFIQFLDSPAGSFNLSAV